MERKETKEWKGTLIGTFSYALRVIRYARVCARYL